MKKIGGQCETCEMVTTEGSVSQNEGRARVDGRSGAARRRRRRRRWAKAGRWEGEGRGPKDRLGLARVRSRPAL